MDVYRECFAEAHAVSEDASPRSAVVIVLQPLQRLNHVVPHKLHRCTPQKDVKVVHTRFPSVGFRSWSQCVAVTLQVLWVIHKPGGRLPLLSAKPAVTLATLKRAATNFAAWWTEAQWVWTVLSKTVTWQRRGWDLNPGPTMPESSTLTTRLPSHPTPQRNTKSVINKCICLLTEQPTCTLVTQLIHTAVCF